MPNISTEKNTNDLYKYVASMTLVFDEEDPIELKMVYIKGIVIDYSFEKHNFPVLYVTMAFDKKIEDLMAKNQRTGSVIFKLQKYISNGDNPDLKINCFEGKFIYVLPTSVADKKELDQVENPEETEDIAKTHTIGLALVDHVNTSKRNVNTVIKSASVSSVIYYILKGHRILMEPIQNNKTISSIILPPLSSASKALAYLNKLYAFYSTGYRFFMDFDVTYLLSSSGKITKRKGESINDVIINIRKIYDEANLEGMITRKDIKAHVINVSSNFCTISDSNMVDKQYNKYTATTTTGKTSNISISDFSGSELTNKRSHLRLPNGNGTYLSAMEHQTKLHNITFAISTTKVDSSIFTLNKRYTINMDDTFGADYSGQYLLTSRRDIYSPEGEGFNVNTTLTFNKIPD